MGHELLELPAQVYALNRADLYLYLLPGVPFVQDGARLPAPERHQLDEAHRQMLARIGIEVQEIGGGWAERFAQAVRLIAELLQAAARGQQPVPPAFPAVFALSNSTVE